MSHRPAGAPSGARKKHARGPGAKPHGPRRDRPAQARRPSPPAQTAGRTAKSDAPRIDPRQLEQALHGRPAALTQGEWLWTTREGAERDLIEELLAVPGSAARPRRLAPALIASAAAPALREGRLDVTFARQGFRVVGLVQAEAMPDLAQALAPALTRCVSPGTPYALHVFVPDSAHGNELSARAQALRDTILAANPSQLLDDTQLRRQGGAIVHVCLCDAHTAAIGCTSSDQALSLWPGGRARMRLGGDFPSRAARKLAEAFAWLGVAPGSGELCVDLGAAPGGWSWLLLEKKARVIAVDPARMDAALARNPRLRHIQGSAFEYHPEQPVDWLFCDMAWRPLEVAQMLGRWARQRHTRLLVANFKLPMKRKFEMVERLRGVLADQGFVGIRTRQLYHDREEITLTAHVR